MFAARRVAVAGAHTPGRTCDGSSRLRRKGGGRHRFSVSTRSRVAIVLAVDRKLRREGDHASKVTVSPDVMVSPKEMSWSLQDKQSCRARAQARWF